MYGTIQKLEALEVYREVKCHYHQYRQAHMTFQSAECLYRDVFTKNEKRYLVIIVTVQTK